jgi:hypothetical protein
MKLTAAARKVLDEHLDELRTRVVREAVRGVRDGAAGTVETRAAIARVALADRLLPASVFDLISMLARPPFAMAFLGITFGVALVAAAGLALGPAGNALLGALLGAAATVVAGVLLGITHIRRKAGRAARDETVAEFLKRLNELEGLATEASGQRLSLRKAVEAVWGREDALVFGRLLRVRDALLHEDAPPPSPAELVVSLLEVDRLARSLQLDGGTGT